MVSEPDLATLERSTYRDEIERQEAPMTLEELGKIIALVWQADQPGGDSAFPAKQELCNLLLSRGNAPSSVVQALRVDYRADGPAINHTALINGAQQAGIVQRVNPGHVKASVGVSPAEARVILQSYINRYPGEVAWARRLMREYRASLEGG